MMMNKSVVVRPKKGLKVFNPATRLHIKESGEEIVISTYWMRRFKDKEIELVEPVVAVKTVKKTKKSSKKSMEVK